MTNEQKVTEFLSKVDDWIEDRNADLAKENEEVFVPKRKNPIIISRTQSSLKILQHARDEAHRFGVAYNRNLRKIAKLKN